MTPRTLADTIAALPLKERMMEMEKYGFWIVKSKEGRYRVCECNRCGIVKRVRIDHLTEGRSQSCMQCGRKQQGMDRMRNAPGVSRSLFSRMLTKARNAINRCYMSRHPSYGNYGERGIRVCDAWADDPPAFANYLAGLPGAENPLLVLDRIDNNKYYEPGNLRFVTRHDSNMNRRKARANHC